MDLLPMNSTLMKNILGLTAESTSPIIRPVQPDDIDLLLAMHRRLSDNSLYNRYHLARQPSRQEIEEIVHLNGKNGRVLVATLQSKIIGLAYFVTTAENTAETALVVEDHYQGQGIGHRLMHALTQAAARQNICLFDALVLPSNKPMIHLLNKSGEIIHRKREYGAVELRVDICPAK